MQKPLSRIRPSRSDTWVKVVSYLLVGGFGLICLYPLLLTLAVSLTSERLIAMDGFRLFPKAFTLDTYTYIFAHSGSRILQSYGVTLFITVAGTLGAVLVTTMISFALSIKTLKYRNVIAFLCNFTLIFSSGIVPWYVVCVNWYKLQNNILAMVVPSLFSVWQMFLMRTYFSAVPTSLYEAARIDGAGWQTIFFRVALPISKTAVLTITMMYALNYWNDWWNALMFINDKNLFPLQYYLYSIVSNVQAISSGRIPPGAAASIRLPSETVKMAVTIITIGPIIFLYPLVQRYFVQGIIMGAVKE
ncbi:MAG TPA: carbohydrate ABC transporter permease [Clostridia bacterium]|nr:carbohydrate ABC transporter permease [Clostridia bacterium]